MAPRVSIIILNYNGLKDTIECLNSLKKITYQNYEVIVVDNASKGNDADILEEKYKDYIILIRNKENLGFTGGNNVGIRKVLEEDKSDYILLLNNDTVVEPNFLDELVKVCQSNSKVGILGPKIYFYDFEGRKDVIQSAGARINLWLGKFEGKGGGEIDKGQFDKISEVDYVGGSCLLIKTEVIKKIGLFDEKYFLYFDETDLCIKAKKAGYLILFVPSSKIWHKQGASTKKENGTEIYYMTRNLFWFERKFANPCQFVFFLGYYFIVVFPQKSIRLLLNDKNLFKRYFTAIKDGFHKN